MCTANTDNCISPLFFRHARKGNYDFAQKYYDAAKGIISYNYTLIFVNNFDTVTVTDLQPKNIPTFLAAKAHTRFTEVLLLLMHQFPTGDYRLPTRKVKLKSYGLNAILVAIKHFTGCQEIEKGL